MQIHASLMATIKAGLTRCIEQTQKLINMFKKSY